VTAAAIATCRVGRIESRGRPGIARRRAARQHAKVVRRLVTGLQAATAAATVVWPAVPNVGLLMLAEPMLNPPGLTFVVL